MHSFLSRDAAGFRVNDSQLPQYAWLWLPLLLTVMILGARSIGDTAFFWMTNNELGFGENFTALCFLLVAVCGFKLARDRDAFEGHWVRHLFLAIGAVALFVTGEEISWGQHFFGWGTPDWLADINKQQETNLHNTAENLLDQKPRAVASFLILLAGAVAPFLYRKGLLSFLDRYPAIVWLIPAATLAPTAVLVFAPRIVDRIQVWFKVSVPEPFFITTRHYQEIQEMFIGLFAALYMIDLVLRVRAARVHRPAAGDAQTG